MTQALTSHDRYQADFKAFEKGLPANGPTWLRDIREEGLASFNKLGFPTARRGNEKWKYTNVTPIANTEFKYPFKVGGNAVNGQQIADVAPWEESWARLVFVDGLLSPTLSSGQGAKDGLRLANLAEAVSQDGGMVEKHLSRQAISGEDGFTAINTAFLRDGAFVHVPDGTAPSTALHLVFATSEGPQPIATHPRTLIVVGRHSRLTVVESYIGLTPTPYFTNAVAEIVVGEGAEVDHYRYMMESANAFHIGTTRVRVDRDATFSSTSFATGGRLARNDLGVLLDAPGGSCVLNGLYFTSDTQHIDNHINIDHAQPHTTSQQYFKGILADSSRAVFSGRVLIRKDAQKTYARQSDKNLILSEGARVNTKPSLEIFADDVQAFHGATAGAVAKDALFYMRSRGLDEETARGVLIHGFASEIIDAVGLPSLRDHLDRLFSRSLPNLQAATAR